FPTRQARECGPCAPVLRRLGPAMLPPQPAARGSPGETRPPAVVEALSALPGAGARTGPERWSASAPARGECWLSRRERWPWLADVVDGRLRRVGTHLEDVRDRRELLRLGLHVLLDPQVVLTAQLPRLGEQREQVRVGPDRPGRRSTTGERRERRSDTGDEPSHQRRRGREHCERAGCSASEAPECRAEDVSETLLPGRLRRAGGDDWRIHRDLLPVLGATRDRRFMDRAV